jgi:hypothetical protein
MRYLKPLFLLLLPALLNAAPPDVPLEPVPPDLPLHASLPYVAPWLDLANVLQPVLHSQFTLLTHLGGRPEHLRQEFGFNTITIQPPDSHNCDTGLSTNDLLSEAQFREGMAAFRAAGYHIILYTSIFANGQTPEWQSGQIAREHPEWSQRDPGGNPVVAYGQPWLCPSTGAREYVLDRTIRLAREYQPDGILLDNNEFYFAKDGWTCHCDACTRAFREYVRKRFGNDRCRRFFGVAPDQLQIPSQEGPLFALWIHWRNRVWAEINESFRARLRQVNPHIMLLANTQYLFDNACLASDLQFEREDVVVSESVGLSSWNMSEKMTLGQAMAVGRPLWNYIGTFVNGNDYTGLKPPEVVSPLIAATIAHQARPWIVDGFDDGPTDARARKGMSLLLAWHDTHPEFFTNTPWAETGVILSLASRNVLHRALIPPNLSALLHSGVPVIALRDDELSPKKLRPFHTVTVETAACLGDSGARALAKWVRAGGVLIAAPDTGSYDSLGRKLPTSTLWKALGLTSPPAQETSVGRGKVIAPTPAAFVQEAINRTRSDSFLPAGQTGVEVVPYRTRHSLVLHVVRHQSSSQPVVLRLPTAFRPSDMTARLFAPGSSDPKTSQLTSTADGTILSLTDLPLYAVVEIALR